ncbi:hypothetical protein ABIF29_005539 [Bradyrhizobium elkanii]|jgi:hypothetical protein|uniref:Uncharacterized protein n=1 Tax=Bradyrhizobium elkanii TaxID=29448 RepID=A0ABV4F5L2_BRAEL|nr:hypothetical protein [Bradyrhizobium elkanii]MCP1976084.1 hypothetical protein [Bradyrhizobium elkanii]MCS3693277.1 hypothetical protein [Bradyrhizobium elkanii]MCS3889399.1 hypothetical protein [Bradyrhizobium elkanii]MCS4211580.1 hypothetical protein [Bradyrhizobium elkanii]
MIAPDIELRALLLPESEPLTARPETHISACPDGPAYPRATQGRAAFFEFSAGILQRIGAHDFARRSPPITSHLRANVAVERNRPTVVSGWTISAIQRLREYASAERGP